MRRTLITLILGLLIGAGIGLYLGWVLYPLEFIDVYPVDLEERYQSDYLDLIATTYASDQNLAAARGRLSSLQLEDWRARVLAHTVDAILNDPDAIQTQHLVNFARDLGLESPAFANYEQTGGTNGTP